MANSKFIPVRGKQDSIDVQPLRDGYVYYAYDTGNMYMDKMVNGTTQRFPIGSGSSGIVYASGNENTITKVSPDDTDFNYDIKLEALADPTKPTPALPAPDSLILNADGRFFRVLSTDESTQIIHAVLLAVSGTGGGGEGGGGIVTDVGLEIDDTTLASYKTYIYGQSYNVRITPTSRYDSYVTLTIRVLNSAKEQVFEHIAQRVPVDQPYLFDMSQLPLSDNLTMLITVISPNSISHPSGFTKQIIGLKVLTLDIKKVSNAYIPLKQADESGDLRLDYMPVGSEGLENVKLHVLVDDVEVDTTAINPSWYNRTVQYVLGRQSYGAHDIKLYISAEASGLSVKTPSITFEAAWADDTSDAPIIWVGDYDHTIVNYENSYIQYMVYDPQAINSGLASEVTLYKDGALIGEMEVDYSTTAWNEWDISSLYTVGNNVFSIICRGSRKDMDIFVTEEGSRDLSLAQSGSLLENFSSAGRSNSEIKSTRNEWNDLSGHGYAATLTGFNWQNNGWRKDAVGSNGVDNGTYLAVANGAKVVIPTPSLRLNFDKDFTLEMRFRVRNVQKYSTLVTTVPLYYYTVLDEDGNEARSATSATMEWIQANNKELWYDEYGSPLMDEKTEKIYQTRDGVISKWLNEQDYGLVIGSQETFFRSSKGIINVRYKEDEVINLSCVVQHGTNEKPPMIFIYLNGILSGAGDLPPSGQTGQFTINVPFTFDSTYCDIDLYRFRIFQTGLTMPEVIHNYLADMHSIVLYDQNQLADELKPTQLSYEALVNYNKSHPGALTMPYTIWKIKNAGRAEKLPYFKGDSCLVDITFVNPCLDEALENGEIDEWYYYTHSPSFIATDVEIDVQGTSSQGYPRRNYKTKYKKATSWVFTKGSLAGESVAKEHTVDGKTLVSKFHMDNEAVGVNKFTWKIDYMESSGSYNTGFANLLGNTKYPLYSKHPLNDLGLDATNLRTSVYGYPVLTFHEYVDASNNPTNPNVTYEYIGRYNMNLDKSANEAYGYESSEKQPYIDGNPKIKSVSECWELSDNQGTWCSFRFPNAAARATGFGTAQPGFDNRLEMIKHFEYRYSPYGDQMDAIGAKGKYDGVVPADKPEIADEIGTNDAQKSAYARGVYYNLERLFFWLDSTDTSTATNGPIVNYQAEKAADGTISVGTTNVSSVTYTTATSYEGKDGATSTPLAAGGYSTTFTLDTVDYRLEKFRNEFSKHLDLEYCLVYFVLTELLLCYDSRGKNMMLASFGPHEMNGEYIWYPTFYDIDTQLGLNNTGAYLWDYDADVTEKGLFSTPTSVLWNNFYTMFNTEIQNKYRVFRGVNDGSNVSNNLSYDKIAGAYECNPDVFDSYAMRGIRPIVAIGLDEYYKYFEIMETGYFTTEGVSVMGTTEFAFQCQGDKKLTTELLLRNRLNYIDSWWLGGAYEITQAKQGQFWGRVNGNRKSLTSDKYLNLSNEEIAAKALTDSKYNGFEHGEYPVAYFDSTADFKLKPFLKQYVSYFTDENTSIPVKYSATDAEADGVWTQSTENTLSVYYDQPETPNEQLTYLPGLDYLSSMGDLSTMYFSEVHLIAGKRLLDLRFGSDIPGYKNDLIDADKAFELTNGTSSTTKKALLKQAIFSNMTTFNKSVDMRGSEKLEEFRALNTALQSVYFANGAPLHTVHLPRSITVLELIEHNDLTNILNTVPVVAKWVDKTTRETVATTSAAYNALADKSNIEVEYSPADSYRGLYLENITDYNSSLASTGHNISTLVIEGGKLGYGSYTILDNLVKLKRNATANSMLAASLKNVVWTPYTVVIYGEEYDANETYYELTDHSTFVPYTYNEATWANDTLNGVIYTYDNTMDSNVITDTSLLDFFIEEYEAGHEQFANTQGLSVPTVPTITGTMFINNIAGDAIIEEDLTAKYAKYFPNLKIQAANIGEANVTKYVRKLDTGILETIEVLRSNGVHPLAPTTQIPAKSGYDFIGWGLDPDDDTLFLPYNFDVNTGTGEYPTGDELESYLNAYTFDNDNTVVVLYAKYRVHQNIVTVWQNGVKAGAMLVNTGSLFAEPTGLYSYDEDGLVDTSNYFNFAPYRNDNDLPLTSTYAFVGYSKVASDVSLGRVTEPVTGLVNKDMSIYAVFAQMSIYDVDYSDLFRSYAVTNYVDEGPEDYASNYNIDEGVVLTVVAPSVKTATGKIVVPASWENKPVIGITDFKRQPGITHIFFEAEHPLRKIWTDCCARMTNLKYVDFLALPQLRVIETRAFQSVMNFNLVSTLGDSATSVLYKIDTQAFEAAFSSSGRASGLNLIQIPASITTMGAYSFGFQSLSNYTVSLEIGTSTQGSHLRMPVISANESPEDRAAFGANQNYAWDTITFWSDGYYNGNDEITDSTGAIRGRLAEYFGLLRDSGNGMPRNFILHSGPSIVTIIDNGTYYETI